MVRYGPEHTGFNPYEKALSTTNVAGLREVWTAVTGDRIESAPAVDGDFVYVGSDDNRLYAYSATGTTQCAGSPKVCTPLWRANLGGNVQSSPAVDGSRVFVGSVGNRISAFDKTGATGCSGNPKVCTAEWSFFFNSDEYSSPTVANTHVFMEENSDAERLTSIDENTGAAAWISTDVETSNPSLLRASPAVAGGVAYALFPQVVFEPGPGLYAYAATGCTGARARCSPLWTASIDVTDNTSPAVANGTVFVAGYNGLGNVSAYDAAGSARCGGVPKVCAPLWTGTDGATSSPAVANGTVYVAAGNVVVAYDAAGVQHCSGTPKLCTPLWRSAPLGSNGISDPVVANGVVYIGSTTGVHALDASTGAALWSSPAGDFSTSSPAVVNGTVYIGGADHKLHVYARP
jgi:outer membrane protein assembly factor BamB